MLMAVVEGQTIWKRNDLGSFQRKNSRTHSKRKMFPCWPSFTKAGQRERKVNKIGRQMLQRILYFFTVSTKMQRGRAVRGDFFCDLQVVLGTDRSSSTHNVEL
ncbi:hypothetical protein ILYODFUR_005502 [Ilyodon furcidens]|uniref:Uncharacterized protein n=1 Tax=Ilyodon furcidens TaxID=33524 RepID=A0ABV0V1E5_9TELE